MREFVGWDYTPFMKWINAYLASKEWRAWVPEDVNADELAAALTQGMEKGESMSKIADRIAAFIPENDKVRAMLIARTEVIRTSAEASLSAYKEYGVETVEWQTAQTDVCELCQELNGQRWPIDEAPRPVTDTHPLCRCGQKPVV